MAAPVYRIYNGPAPTTSMLADVTTGTTLKTMLQLLCTKKCRIVEWGYSFAAAPADPIQVELLSTGTVAATVTALADADVVRFNDNGADAPPFTFSASATGHTSNGTEGTITTSDLFAHNHDNASLFKQQFPLGREPEVKASDILRIRVLAGTAVDMTCYIDVEV